MNDSTSDTFVAQSDKMPTGFFQYAKCAIHRFGFAGSIVRYLLLKQSYRRFIQKGATPADQRLRKTLLKKFARIERQVPTAHYPHDLLLIAEAILDLAVAGPIVECGAFKGCSSAKLSLLAEATGRKLYVCDSFEGLPEPEAGDELTAKGFGDMPDIEWAPGEFKGTIEEVRSNLEHYGHLASCELVQGYFKDSLPSLDIRPAFIFMDVDLASSGRDVLKHLWPRLQSGGLLYTHEASFPEYLKAIWDPQWWQDQLTDAPPLLYGAGCGLSILSPHLAYTQKA